MPFNPNKLQQKIAEMQKAQPTPPPEERSFMSKLPAIAGGAIGGIAAAPFGLVGSVPAAGVGYATGEQLYRMASGQPPMKPGEYGKEAALAGAGELVGGSLMKGAASLTKAAMPSLVRTMQGIPNNITKWVIERGSWKTLKDFTKVDPELPSRLIASFQEGVKDGRRIASQKWSESIRAVTKKMDNSGKGINIRPVYDKTQKIIDELTSDPSYSFAVKKTDLQTLKDIKIALNNYKTQPISVSNALKMRQGLDSIIEYPHPGTLPQRGNKINNALIELRRELDTHIKRIPEIKKADAEFAEMARAYDSAESLLKGQDLEVKVLNILKRGTDASRKLEKIDKLISKKGSHLDAIKDAAAKVAFKEPMRPSVPFGPLAVAGSATGGIMGGVDVFMKALSILPTLGLVTSPRVAGHALRLGERAFTSLPATAARYGVSPTAIAEYERMGKK